MTSRRIEGSYRDPSGHVYDAGDHILRSVRQVAVDDFDAVVRTGLLARLVADGALVPFEEVARDHLAEVAPDAVKVLRHPRLEFISHPYEWSFPALRAAALLHLDIQLSALESGVTLSDASAYNLQFVGSKPVFIDHLSFKPYHDGEFWAGHRQFCEQFLNPLLLTSLTGVPFQTWYRGSFNGLPAREIAPLLPIRSKFSRRALLHVHLMGGLQGAATQRDAVQLASIGLPRARFRKTLEDLRGWVAGLSPKGSRYTEWSDYAGNTSYLEAEGTAKRDFVRDFVATTKPGMVWDIGCNTGDFSAVALAAGARTVVGFEFDHGALDGAFFRAAKEGLALLPLYLDAANPSPDQGWAQRERSGLERRRSADGLLALALVHHLAISRNIPLAQVVAWLVSLAPAGVIEFVPKADPMVGRLLSLRADVFEDYDEATFLAALESTGRVVRTSRITDTGRLLAWFERA